MEARIRKLKLAGMKQALSQELSHCINCLRRSASEALIEGRKDFITCMAEVEYQIQCSRRLYDELEELNHPEGE